MNVLMITRESDILRDGSNAQSLAKEQSKLVNRLMVVVMNDRSAPSQPRKIDKHLWVFPTNSVVPVLAALDTLRVVEEEILFRNQLQADLIVGNDPFMAGTAAYLASRRYNRPLHIHASSDYFLAYDHYSIPEVTRALYARFIVSRAHTVSVTRDSTRDSLVKMDPAFGKCTTVVPNYIDVGAIANAPITDDLHLKYTQFRAIILVVAPLIASSNVQVAIKALADISQYHVNIGLLIVGDGPQKHPLQLLVQQLGLGNQVIFEPMREDLVSYYKSAAFLMVPSLYEEYGTTIEDAAASGCAIVSSPVGIAPSIIEHEKNGYLCDPNNPQTFINAAGALIRHDTVRLRMRKEIQESIRAYMSKDKKSNVQLYLSAWESALKSGLNT